MSSLTPAHSSGCEADRVVVADNEHILNVMHSAGASPDDTDIPLPALTALQVSSLYILCAFTPYVCATAASASG